MKKIVFFILIIILIIVSCAQETKSPIEGAWKLVYGKWTSFEQSFPDQIKGSSIKFWSKEHFAFDGQFKLDTTILDNYGWGTYVLNGEKYEENIILHADKPSIGTKVRLLVEIRNDTLIQRYPADENWELPEKYSTEKFIRVK